MSVDELKKIVEELKNASKMHASQAERVQAHIDEMEESQLRALLTVLENAK